MPLLPDLPILIRPPKGARVPVVFDSPHSGTLYPDDFGTVLPLATLRTTEDLYVDELYAAAPEHGAPLLGALFPRIYIDPNRNGLDIDEALLDGPWTGPLKPNPKTAGLGSGLIWRTCDPDLAIYDRKLPVAEAKARIERCWRPYHTALKRLIDEAQQEFGEVWHIDCHSMQSFSNAKSPERRAGIERADFILGDRAGTTSSAEFTELVRSTLAAMGYRVTLNDPYNGGELVVAYSDAKAGRHSLQIEIKRNLYMDEKTLDRNAGFAALKANLTKLIGVVCDYARAKTAARPARRPAAAR